MDFLTDFFRDYDLIDEFIARDLVLIELLEQKNIITREEIKDIFDKLPDKIKEIHEYRLAEAKKTYEN